MERESTALKMLMLTGLDQLVRGVLVLRAKRDNGSINPIELLQLVSMENDLDAIVHDIGSNPQDFSLIGRA